MICNECSSTHRFTFPQGLSTEEVIQLCRVWKCKKCTRTQEEIDADFEKQFPALPLDKRAHDWSSHATAARTQVFDEAKMLLVRDSGRANLDALWDKYGEDYLGPRPETRTIVTVL